MNGITVLHKRPDEISQILVRDACVCACWGFGGASWGQGGFGSVSPVFYFYFKDFIYSLERGEGREKEERNIDV